NLLVTQAGGLERVKVADFGLARAYQDSALSGLTMTGTMGGAPQYGPPEQITAFRSAQPTADPNATAATLYPPPTPRHAYEASTPAELLRKKLIEEPVPLASRRADLPAGLAAAVDRAMARLPQNRYADVREMAQALGAFG